ncbi:MAG: glycosyl hydrolase family 3, partial [Muribaculaceae bacterium]|nr:glycosyl hydrolase family 3 [Muribaculaceae bacterium]
MIFSGPSLRLLCLITLTALGVVLGACGRKEKGSGEEAEVREEPEVAADLTSEALNYADSLLATMSLEERIGQCFMPAIYSSSDSLTMRQLRRYISDFHVGGVVLLKGDLESVAKISGIVSRARIPLFLAIDAEWGLGMRLKDAPAFPRNGRISGNADEQLMFEYGSEVARECRRIGVNMVLGPVIDVVGNTEGIIGSRSFGSDRERVALLGTAYARGVESGRVISVAKHFPGHGSPSGDSHKEMQVISRSLHTLDSVDLYPFRRYIETGLSGIMVGHLAVPAIDPEMLPAAVSPVVITDLLRGELEFTGLVLAD